MCCCETPSFLRIALILELVSNPLASRRASLDPCVISSSLVGQYQFITAFSTFGVDQIAYGERFVLVREFYLMRTADPVMCSHSMGNPEQMVSLSFKEYFGVLVRQNTTIMVNLWVISASPSVAFPAKLTKTGAGTNGKIWVGA